MRALIVLVVIVLNMVFGGFFFQYSLWSIFGKDVPWYVDAISGLFLAEVVGPIALFCWIAQMCGVSAPFVH